MAVDSLVKQLATASLSKEQQLALISELQSSIQAKQEQEDTLEEAAKVIGGRIKKLEGFVKESVKEMQQIAKVPGPQGPAGKDGKQGVDGKSIVGPAGRDGKDGQDGTDGKDGATIVDVYWAADNSLVCVLSDGREIDSGPLMDAALSGDGASIITQRLVGGDSAGATEEFITRTFETVNKNLAASGGVLAYNAGGDLITITYDNGIIKTLAYNAGGDLISVTLSGSTPAGIDLVKTFSYNGAGDLVTFTYS